MVQIRLFNIIILMHNLFLIVHLTGIVTAVYDSSVGIVTFQALYLNIFNQCTDRSYADVVGFAATSAVNLELIDSLSINQPAGTERSGLLESTGWIWNRC